MGLSFDSPNLLYGPASISFRPTRDLSYEDMWRLVSLLAQSADGFDITDQFNIRVYNVSMLSGHGRVMLICGDVAKHSIVEINNSDNLCFPQAFVVAQSYSERGNILQVSCMRNRTR